MDFTLKKYRQLLLALKANYNNFQTYLEFLEAPKSKSIVLRHDVDLLPENSLMFARIQAENNIKCSYYFRAVPESWDEKIIKEIADLGHEIGYHYECLTTCGGDMDKAILDFEKNLKALRGIAPVKTICMHGSPMSKYDSKDLWKKYDYKNYGIQGEPYFDTDFKQVFYLTDTGRCWDGHKVSIRDKVNSGFDLFFHSTDEIIEAVNNQRLPAQIMFTFHPQRWTDSIFLWYKELVAQTIKNQVKRAIAGSKL